MEVGIVGPPLSGKTTLFRALTAGKAEIAVGAMKPNVGVAHIPDPRLDTIAEHVPTQKLVQATLQLSDVPGFEPGAGTGAKILDAIRQADALCVVIRCFDAAGQAPNPSADIDAFETELILADLLVVENALPRAERSARTREPKAVARFETLKTLAPALEEGEPVRAVVASGRLADQGHLNAIREMGFVSAKKTLYVANVAEDDVAGASEHARAVFARAEAEGMGAVALCAEIEAELVDLEEADRREMLEGLGLTEPALPALARALYTLLGLQSFYTAGPKEVRAWTVRAGATAPEAAGKIHSDIERGFIRAEVYSVADLIEHKSEKAIRDAGKLRTEGKSYTLQDADVCNFLFNV